MQSRGRHPALPCLEGRSQWWKGPKRHFASTALWNSSRLATGPNQVPLLLVTSTLMAPSHHAGRSFGHAGVQPWISTGQHQLQTPWVREHALPFPKGSREGGRTMCWSRGSGFSSGFYEISGIFQKPPRDLPFLLLAHTDVLMRLCLLSPSHSQSPGSTALCKNAWAGIWQHCSNSSASQTLCSTEKNTLQGIQTHSSVTLADSKFILHSANLMQRGRWVKSILSPLLTFPCRKSRITEVKELTTATPTSCCVAQFRALFPAAFSYTLVSSCMSPRSFSSSL